MDTKVIEFINKSTKQYADGTYLGYFKCYCGEYFYALLRYIKTGKQISCGCYRRSGGSKHRIGKSPGNSLLDPMESSFNSLYCSYKASARNRLLSFELTKKQFKEITGDACHYCGVSPRKHHLVKWGRKPYIYNGIDRKDNTKGYILSNSLSCCEVCNYLKKASTYDFFIAHIKRISLNLAL